MYVPKLALVHLRLDPLHCCGLCRGRICSSAKSRCLQGYQPHKGGQKERGYSLLQHGISARSAHQPVHQSVRGQRFCQGVLWKGSRGHWLEECWGLLRREIWFPYGARHSCALLGPLAMSDFCVCLQCLIDLSACYVCCPPIDTC